MLNNLVKKLLLHCLQVVYIQVALSFVYVPILIYWGLPISVMSIVGNLIFTPFLFLFILCAFFVFVTEIVCLPNGMLCTVLNELSSVWIKALSIGSPKWLLGFAYTSAWSLILFTGAGLIILWISRTWNLLRRVIIVTIVLIIGLTALKFMAHSPVRATIAYHQTQFLVENNNNQLTLIIPRTGIYKKSFGTWFLHTARRELYRTFGQANINTIVLINPTPNTVKLIEECKNVIGYQQLIIKH